MVAAVLAAGAPAEARYGRPTEAGTSGHYTVPEHSPPHCTANTCVHWVETTNDAPDLTDSDGDGAPDAVETVASEFERTRTRQTGAAPAGLGWAEPKSDGDLGGGPRSDVYLMALGGRTLGSTPVSACAGGTCSGYIVLEHSLRGQLLQEIIAHEFNHLVTYATEPLVESWLFESTAVWMSDRANDGVLTWLRFVERWAGATEDKLTDNAPLHMYGAAVWLQWLDERYGPEIVREVWERAPREYDYTSRGVLLGFDAAIAGRGGAGFADEFGRFAAALPEWRLPGSGFSDGPAFPDVERVATLTPDGPPVERQLLRTSFALLDVAPGPAPASALRLEASLPTGASGALALVGRTRSGTVNTSLRQLPAGGPAEVTLEDPERFERITAVLINAQIPGGSSEGPPVASARIVAIPRPPDETPPEQPAPAPPVEPTPPAETPLFEAPAPFSVAVFSGRQHRLRAVLPGLPFKVRVSGPAQLTARLVADRRVARLLGLRAVADCAVVGRVAARLYSAGSRRLVIRLPSRVKRRLHKLRRVRLVLEVIGRDSGGQEGADRRVLTIRR